MSKSGTVLAVLAGIVAIIAVVYFAVFKSTPAETMEAAQVAGMPSVSGEITLAPVVPLLGDDVDEHGCRASAGYVWNETQNACVRPWELTAVTPIASIEQPIASPIIAPLASQQALIVATPVSPVYDPATAGMVTITGAAEKGVPDGAWMYTAYDTKIPMIYVYNPSHIGGTCFAKPLSEYLKGGYRACGRDAWPIE